MKIIFSWQLSGTPTSEAMFEEWRNAGYSITPINHRKELGIENSWSPQKLNELYANKDETLGEFYNKIVDLAETHDVLIVNYENVFHAEFIKSLRNKHIYTVIVYGDDPENSDYCSKPYVHAFDHSFCLGVNFDKDTRITEKYLEWGAKRADWWPHGLREHMYNPSLTEEDINNGERDIDLVYVGTRTTKLGRLVKIKKAFPQMKIYGRNWKTVFANPLAYKRIYGRWSWRECISVVSALFLGLWRVKELPSSDLVPLYQRCKIGINLHMSFGPSNLRTYVLPANGVMQICDCPEGLHQIFEIGKEVIPYHSIEEAIELIRYYLEHDDERKKIAYAGFNRTVKDYQRLSTFSHAMDKIKKGMFEDDIRYFKDGTLLRYEE